MDDTETNEAKVDHTPITKRDVVEQRFEKIFPEPPRGEIVGGVFTPSAMVAMLDFAKAMATATNLGAHLRGNVGDCLMMVSMAAHHGLNAYSLASWSYAVNGRTQFEAKFAVTLIHTSRLLKERLRYEYAGEGEARTCAVIATFRGEATPQTYTSPPLARITPKKSPLWDSDPDQQLAYYSARAWGRRYCPEVLAGFHFDGDEPPVDVTPNRDAPEAAGLHARLASQAATPDEREPFTGELPSGMAVAATHAVEEPARDEAAPTPGKPTRGHRKPYVGAPASDTPAAYLRHVARWLPDCETEQAVEARWRTEARLRTQCRVTANDRDQARALLDQRIAKLR
jgi:hypothetical protein